MSSTALRRITNGVGYLKSSNFFNFDEIKLLDDSVNALINQAQEIDMYVKSENISLARYYRENPQATKLIVVMEDSSDQISRIEYLSGTNEDLSRLFQEKIATHLVNLSKSPISLFKDKCNLKYPGGGYFGPHQDYIAYQHFPSKFNITAMIAIDDADLSNGCIQFASNYKDVGNAFITHSDSVKFFNGFPIFKENSKGEIVKEVSNELEWNAIPVKRGDIVLFDHFIPHFSEMNLSNRSRKAIFVTYSLSTVDRYENYYSEKRNGFSNPIFHVATPTSLGK